MHLNIKKERDMKKAAKVEFGITITKPWSKEMYDHNEMVADVVRQQVSAMWEEEEIQRAITACGFGYGYSVAEVAHVIDGELENAPLYRLNEIAEDLELDLKVGFVGFR